LQSTLTTLQPTLLGIGTILSVAVIGAFNLLAASISNIVDISLPLIDQILSTLELLSGALSGVAQVAVGVSTGDWTLAWSGMKTIFESFYTYFSTTAENIKTLMSGIVTFASEALVGTLEAFGVDTSGVVATTESLVAFIKNFTWPEWPGAPEFVLKLID
jgi:phage-related protein